MSVISVRDALISKGDTCYIIERGRLVSLSVDAILCTRAMPYQTLIVSGSIAYDATRCYGSARTALLETRQQRLQWITHLHRDIADAEREVETLDQDLAALDREEIARAATLP